MNNEKRELFCYSISVNQGDSRLLFFCQFRNPLWYTRFLYAKYCTVIYCDVCFRI